MKGRGGGVDRRRAGETGAHPASQGVDPPARDALSCSGRGVPVDASPRYSGHWGEAAETSPGVMKDEASVPGSLRRLSCACFLSSLPRAIARRYRMALFRSTGRAGTQVQHRAQLHHSSSSSSQPSQLDRRIAALAYATALAAVLTSACSAEEYA